MKMKRNMEPELTGDAERLQWSIRGVAQPGSAPALGAGGPRFESLCPDQTIDYQRGRVFIP